MKINNSSSRNNNNKIERIRTSNCYNVNTFNSIWNFWRKSANSMPFTSMLLQSLFDYHYAYTWLWCRCKISETLRFVYFMIFFLFPFYHPLFLFVCKMKMCFCFSQTNCVMNKFSMCAIEPAHAFLFSFLCFFFISFSWHDTYQSLATIPYQMCHCHIHKNGCTSAPHTRSIISISILEYYVNNIVVCIQNETVIKMTGFMENVNIQKSHRFAIEWILLCLFQFK